MQRFIGILSGILFSISCSNSILAADEAQPPLTKAWTFLIFLNADNNLEDFGYEDIHEMEKVGSTKDINVVVQFDGLKPEGTSRILIQKDPAAVNDNQDHKFLSPVVEEMEEQDMGSTKTFIDFVTWGMKKYPAEHYLVVMWNHGSGWSKETIDANKSISYDDTSNTHIRTNELSDAVDEIVQRSGKRIDVFSFDACLMSMLEIGDSLAGMVDFMVASQETEPGDGYPYDDILATFDARENKTPEVLIQDIVYKYGAAYSKGGSQKGSEVTYSAIDLSKIELLKKRLNKWVEVIAASVASKNLDRADLVTSARETQSYADSHYRDLGDYVRNVLSHTTVSEDDETRAKEGSLPSKDIHAGVVGASLGVLRALDEAVVHNFRSDDYLKSNGLSIYLPISYGNSSPWTSSFSSDRREAYMELKWATSSKWTSHLDLLFPKPTPAPATQPSTQPSTQPATQPATQPSTQPVVVDDEPINFPWLGLESDPED